MAALKIPILRYGGKSYLAKWIVSHFPAHRTYIEPFCGSGAVILSKEPSQAEIINDLDNRIVNVFEQLRSRPFELAALLWATPYAQENWRNIPQSEIEQAAMYIAKSKQFYAGNTGTSTFSLDAGHANKNKARVWADWFRRILPAAARLKDVQIVNRDAVDLVRDYAHLEDALFYLDPPYMGHEREYEFAVNYKAMLEAIKNIKGRAIVSEYPAAQIHFQGWRMETRTATTRARCGAHKMKADKKTECLFMNF